MIGKRLKELREKSGKSQQEVCKDLCIEQSTLANYENDRRDPKLNILCKIAAYYKCSTDYLLGAENENQEGICVTLDYATNEENITTFPNKLAFQLDCNQIKPSKLANDLGIPELTVLKWLTGNDDSYTNYYQELSDYFHVLVRYWTSPHALSPGIELNTEEYILINLHRHYKETGRLDEEIYGSLDNFFPGITIGKETPLSPQEEKMLNTFKLLNEDNQDIIIGKAKEMLRDQRREESGSVAADPLLKKAN